MEGIHYGEWVHDPQAGITSGPPNPSGVPDEVDLTRLEQELVRVPGIRSARVKGNGSPSEIHIVATKERSPKQLVRDVQSLASAGFDMPIDHRIVSVVQLEDSDADVSVAATRRPVLDRVVVVSKGGLAWIKVVLQWPDGETTEGLSTAERSREARARAATVAALRALQPAFDKSEAQVEIRHVLLQSVGSEENVLVRGTYSGHDGDIDVSGSAVIHDDVSTAAVHSVLHALNRKLT